MSTIVITVPDFKKIAGRITAKFHRKDKADTASVFTKPKGWGGSWGGSTSNSQAPQDNAVDPEKAAGAAKAARTPRPKVVPTEKPAEPVTEKPAEPAAEHGKAYHRTVAVLRGFVTMARKFRKALKNRRDRARRIREDSARITQQIRYRIVLVFAVAARLVVTITLAIAAALAAVCAVAMVVMKFMPKTEDPKMGETVTVTPPADDFRLAA